MLYKKVLFVAIAMLFSFNNAHAQFFKKLMKTVQEVGEVVTEITGETSDGTPVNSNTTTTSSNFNSSQNNTAPATTTKADDGSFSMSLNAPGYEIKLLGGNRTGDLATYDFVIFNKTGKTREVYVVTKEGCAGYEEYRTFASDDQYEIYNYQEKMKVLVGGQNVYTNNFSLSAHVPTKMRIVINNVSANAKMIPYLSVAFRNMADGPSYGQALLQIKNLPLE